MARSSNSHIRKLPEGGVAVMASPFLGLDLRSDPKQVRPGTVLLSQNFVPYNAQVFSKRKGTVLKNATAWADVLSVPWATRFYISSAALVTGGTCVIGSNLTIPANVTLWMFPGAMLKILTGATLTHSGGPLTLPAAQVFTWTGTGKVVIGAGVVSEVSPYWWGAVCDGVTDDAAAFQAALTATPVGIPLRMPKGSGVCHLHTALSIVKGVQIVGSQGSDSTGFGTDQAINVFTVTMSGGGHALILKDFSIIGGVNGIEVTPSSGYLFRMSRFENLNIANQTNACLKLASQMIGMKMSKINCDGGATSAYGLWAEGDDVLGSVEIEGLRVTGTVTEGVHLVETSVGQPWPNTRFVNPIIETNQGIGVYTYSMYSEWINAHFETNGSVTGGADMHLESDGVGSNRTSLYGGYFSTASVAQSGTRFRFGTTGVRLLVEKTGFAGTAKVDAGGFVAASSIVTVDTGGNPDATTTFPGGNRTDIVGGVVTANALFSAPTNYASLPTIGVNAANGYVMYCSDCAKATPCTGSSTGAFAKARAGVWDCD